MAKFDLRIFKVLAMVALALSDVRITKEEAKSILVMVIDLFLPGEE